MDVMERMGRGLFLATVLGGLSSLAWGKPVWDRISAITDGLPLPVGGWRIYTISGSMPRFDPDTWTLEIGGLVERPLSLPYEELRAPPRAHQGTHFPCVPRRGGGDVRRGGGRGPRPFPRPPPHAGTP